jgi:hypothetical protein
MRSISRHMHQIHLQRTRPAIRFLLAAACAAAGAPTASAQGPKPPGTFGFELVAEDPGPGASDVLTVLALQAATPGAALVPALQASLTADVNGDGTSDVIKVNAAENGTTWQVATAPEMVIAIDPGLGTPIVFLPATAPAFSAAAVSYVDFRFGGTPVVGALFGAGGTDIPLQLITDGAGRIYVVESLPGAGMSVSEITFGGGSTPKRTVSKAISGLDAEFQDRMALGGSDAGNSTLSIPHTRGVDVFSIPGLALLGTVPMPANGAGVRYVPFTNILAGLPGPFDMLVFGGQPGGGGGHTYVSWSSATGAAGPTGGIDPAGAALRPAAGFHEPAFTPTGTGTGTVTALLDTFPFGGGAGAIFQVPVGSAGPGGAVITAVSSPFGDPEPARNGLADPIGFQVGTPPTYSFGAVTAGAFGPVGSVSPLSPLIGALTPGDSPRPLAMSLAGFPGSDFALTTSTIAHVFTVSPGPVVTAVTFFTAGGGPTSLGTVWTQGAVGGALPVHFQEFAGPGVMMRAGLPLAVPTLALLAASPVAIPPMGGGGYVGVPPAQGLLPSVSAGRASLNFTSVGVQGSWATLHPSPGIAPPAVGTATIAPAAAYGATAAFYPGSGAFVTEFASF